MEQIEEIVSFIENKINKNYISEIETGKIGEMVIDNLRSNSVIDVYDILGREILSFESSNKEVKQNVSDFSTGIYIVRITDESGMKAHKVIIE